MFVVTSAGVIATDPIGYGRPQAVTTYLDEIKKVTDKPVKYLIYSHHHYDHIAGGQPFKDAGAKIIAHKRAKERLALIKDPFTPMPDEVMDKKRVIKLGDTSLELTYHGINHSDSTIAMRLPKEKILFVVDVLPVGSVPGRGMIDFHPLEAEKSIESMLAMDWDRMIPGHPGPGGPARHQGRCACPVDVPARRLRRGEDRRARRQMLGYGGKGSHAAQVRILARLHNQPALRAAPLLRLVGPRHLSTCPPKKPRLGGVFYSVRQVQPRTCWLKNSSVRCQDSFAAASSNRGVVSL